MIERLAERAVPDVEFLIELGIGQILADHEIVFRRPAVVSSIRSNRSIDIPPSAIRVLRYLNDRQDCGRFLSGLMIEHVIF